MHLPEENELAIKFESHIQKWQAVKGLIIADFQHSWDFEMVPVNFLSCRSEIIAHHVTLGTNIQLSGSITNHWVPKQITSVNFQAIYIVWQKYWTIAIAEHYVFVLERFGSSNWLYVIPYIDGLVQQRRNTIANALELRLSCTKPLIWYCYM